MYEHILVRHVFAPLADSTIERATPGPNDRVLDIATGTGIILRKIGERVGQPARLSGLDLNPGMIAVGSAIAESSGLEIEWLEGDASELPFDEESFDWIFCQHGLQFIPDREGALNEFHKVLDANGTAVISVWRGLDEHPLVRTLNEACYQHTGQYMLGTPFSLGEPEILQSLADDAGFRETQIEKISFTAYFDAPEAALRMTLAGGTAAIPEFQQMDDAERVELIDGIMEHARPHLAPFIHGDHLVCDWNANVVVAAK